MASKQASSGRRKVGQQVDHNALREEPAEAPLGRPTRRLHLLPSEDAPEPEEDEVRSTRVLDDVEGNRREVRPEYNRAGGLERLFVDDALYVDRIAYDAKGQRALVAYGNGVMTRHAYDPDTFRLILRLMLESPFLLIRAALPAMYERGWGRVVNISSAHGLRASAFKSAYVSAKHGLEGLSKVTALEGAPHGVTSNCINPAYVRTPLVEKQIADQAAVHGIAESEVVEKIMLTESAVKRLVSERKSATSRSSATASSCPATSAKVTRAPSGSCRRAPLRTPNSPSPLRSERMK